MVCYFFGTRVLWLTSRSCSSVVMDDICHTLWQRDSNDPMGWGKGDVFSITVSKQPILSLTHKAFVVHHFLYCFPEICQLVITTTHGMYCNNKLFHFLLHLNFYSVFYIHILFHMHLHQYTSPKKTMWWLFPQISLIIFFIYFFMQNKTYTNTENNLIKNHLIILIHWGIIYLTNW